MKFHEILAWFVGILSALLSAFWIVVAVALLCALVSGAWEIITRPY